MYLTVCYNNVEACHNSPNKTIFNVHNTIQQKYLLKALAIRQHTHILYCTINISSRNITTMCTWLHNIYNKCKLVMINWQMSMKVLQLTNLLTDNTATLINTIALSTRMHTTMTSKCLPLSTAEKNDSLVTMRPCNSDIIILSTGIIFITFFSCSWY